jgi:1-acyl-sn-glycerol-3-phosphate acyltransferase
MLELIRFLYYWGVTGLVCVVSLMFYPCRVKGLSHIPRKGGFILASNHESNIDPVLLPVVCPRRMRFLAKDSLFRNPVLGFLIRFGGGIPVRRASADRQALTSVLDQLEKGVPVLMFPQGTRGGERIQPGVAFLAIKSAKPVIPVYIEGTAKVLPKGARFPRRSGVRVVFGKPIFVPSSEKQDQAAKRIMEAVFALKEEAD